MPVEDVHGIKRPRMHMHFHSNATVLWEGIETVCPIRPGEKKTRSHKKTTVMSQPYKPYRVHHPVLEKPTTTATITSECAV